MQTKNIKTKMFSLVLLFLMLFIAGAFYFYIKENIQKQGRAKFENQSQAISNDIKINLIQDINFLYSLGGLYSASNSVERNEFKAFGEGSEVSKNLPGVYAIEFVEKVSVERKEDFIQEIRNDFSIKPEGYPEFNIYPEEKKEEYFALKYFFPEDLGNSILGFDYSTENNRKRAMEEALKRNSPVVTEKIKIIGSDKDAFVVLLPIYKKDNPIATFEERKESLKGFVGVIIEVESFFDSAVNSEKIDWNSFDLYVYDQAPGSNINLENYLYDVDKEEEEDNKSKWSYFQDLPLNVADKTWTLHFVANPNYGISNLESIMMLILIVFGVIFSFFIAGSFYFLGTSRSRAIDLAESMTEDLRSSEERFRSITEAAKDAIVMIDNKGKIVLWNKAAENMFGYESEEVFGKELHKIIPVEEAHKKEKSNLERFGETGESSVLGKSIELPVKNKKGEIFQVELTIARTKLKEKWHAVGIMRDITERKKLEGIIQEKIDNLERFNKLVVDRERKRK